MKTAMIWGANGGIGRAILNLLHAQGWTTIAVGRKPEALVGSASYVLEADVSRPWEIENVIYEAATAVEKVNLWVYAVGDIASQKVAQLPPADWTRIIDANLSGAFAAIHHSLPLLADDCHLVFLGAVSERLRLPGLSAYAAAKAGLEAFAEALAKEQRNMRVTVVRPGAVDTPLWDKVPLRLPADAPKPEKVAGKILAAHESGHKGNLDLF